MLAGKLTTHYRQRSIVRLFVPEPLLAIVGVGCAILTASDSAGGFHVRLFSFCDWPTIKAIGWYREEQEQE